jgi:thiol-disulfide isomerase/thioredoxin
MRKSNLPVRPRNLFVVGTILLTLLCLLGSTACNLTGGSSTTGSSVPDYEIPTVEGGKIQLSQYRGKVVVLDFWAPWCGPCQAETPHLIKIAQEYKDKDVVVIGLSIPDPRTRDGQVEQFVKEFGVNYTIGFAPHGMFEKFDCTPDADGAIPQTFVFGRDGRKIWENYGFNPMGDGENLQRKVEQAASVRNASY